MPELSTFPITIIAILVAITVHEWAHAYTAYKLGDDTARWAGRMTLNPIAHIDLLGAILFLLVGFGWAKPVPVDPRNLRHPVRDGAVIALAGPVSNLVIAFICAAALELFESKPDAAPMIILILFLQSSLSINLALMAFNLLPIPPLDGSNILRLFIPWRLRDRYDEFLQYGPWILLGVIVAENALHLPILSWWVHTIIGLVLELFLLILRY